MTPLARAFADRRAAGGAAFIPYLTHGFPDPTATPDLLDGLAAAGADVIELGVPHSDPLADGPVIQRASQQALAAGADLQGALRLVRQRAAALPPIVLFTYLNPVLRYGPRRFAEEAAGAGIAGLLMTDLPVGADPSLEEVLGGAGPALVRLAAPTARPERLARIAREARGFLYYISRRGVTGARDDLPASLAREVRTLKDLAEVPVAVGFGISRPAQAAAVAAVADGVVVGSALIAALERDRSAFLDLAGGLAEATHGG